MARPPSIKDETIIAAAREVFLERGIQATTAEVAERAGVSEGSIFKRFKTKDELFRAAMAENVPTPPWAQSLPGRAGQGDLRETLFALGMEIIAFFRTIMPLALMAWSNPAPNGLPIPLAGPNPPPMRALKQLTGFFEAEMRAGRLRRHDPEVVARSYLGGLHGFVFFELLYQANGELPLAAETYVRGHVNLLLTGAEPASAGSAPKAGAGNRS